MFKVVEYFIMTLLQIYHWFCNWKNFENRSTFGEVTDKSIAGCFLTHSVRARSDMDHTVLPANNTISAFTPSRSTSLQFGRYSLRLPTEWWPGWVDLGGWLDCVRPVHICPWPSVLLGWLVSNVLTGAFCVVLTFFQSLLCWLGSSY